MRPLPPSTAGRGGLRSEDVAIRQITAGSNHASPLWRRYLVEVKGRLFFGSERARDRGHEVCAGMRFLYGFWVAEFG
jgi:hypothetical protein